ncbi:sugar-phosphate dehydrogenase [Citrobacter freundii]|nr:sugar-phosphate dehydrogenase [Citrobacter freundii]
MTGGCHGTKSRQHSDFHPHARVGIVRVWFHALYILAAGLFTAPIKRFIRIIYWESSDSDWGICEVNLMPGNDATLIQNLKAQDLLYTVAERGAQSTELKIIGSMNEALHPEFDGSNAIIRAMARPETAIVSLTITEKGYCTDPASGELDLNHPFIQHDIENPQSPKSAIGYIVEALALRREQGLKPFTVLFLRQRTRKWSCCESRCPGAGNDSRSATGRMG